LYRFAEKLDFSLVLQQVRSFSKFEPGFADAGLSSDIQRISQTETRENSLSARGEYQLTKNISCLLDYSYRDYDDKTQGLFSGTLHTVSAFVRAKW
jgi:predicted porin